VGGVIVLDGFENFVGLFDQIRKETFVSLLLVPRAAAWGTEVVDYFLEAEEAV
jgi:hypothetical protein